MRETKRFLVLIATCACASGDPVGIEDDADPDGGGGGVADASIDVPVPPDADTTDAAPRLGFGEPCTDKSQCESNICIFTGLQGVCSMLCVAGSCPDGYGCYGVLGIVEPGVVSDVCVPKNDLLCSPCTDSSECGIGAPNLCWDQGDGSRFCAQDCTTIGCPMGFTCSSVMLGGTTYKQCLPASGACDCNESNMGDTKPCAITTPFGLCGGSRTCLGATGWSACQPPSASDPPDGAFVDANCDGIDGEYDKGIFVATSGTDDATCGTSHMTPCRTIGHGITRAQLALRPNVYVQAGAYNEVVTLKENVSVWGGYNATWKRDNRTIPGHEVRIVGGLDATEGQWMTMKAHHLSLPTTVADLVIQGPNASGSLGGSALSSYGVHVKNTTGLSLVRVTIQAGNGAPGATGTMGLDAPVVTATSGMNGAQGGNAAYYYSLCDTTSKGLGGAAGTNSCSGGLNPNAGPGGNGGTMDTTCDSFWGWCSNCTATPGSHGGNAIQWATGSYGYRGSGGSGGDSCGPAGSGNAGRVQNGAAGTKGLAGGYLSNGYWYAFAGGAGGVGQHGGGGGGGGGSGGCDNGAAPFENSHGAGGGGGGAGGCAAQSAGGGGGGGGGSFGIFAVSSTFTVTDCDIQRGTAGNGGTGGVGGRGQSGGAGGPGGLAAGSGSAGGPGGKGGHGGHGGGGGGGAGGISYGIYSHASTVTQSCSFSGGAAGGGGLGGPSAPTAPVGENDGNPGQPGDSGTVGDVGICATPGACG